MVAVLGIALLGAQAALNIRLDGCEKYYDALGIMHCKFILSASGYGYNNPSAINISTSLLSGCQVIQPHIQDSYNRISFVEQVQYIPGFSDKITRTELTSTNLTKISP
jgi:hypothetical protein